MQWSDEGYLLSKNNFGENSIIIESFTLKHGKYSGLVYGGASRRQKKIFQIGNKIFLNWKSRGENKTGYFTVELIKPIAPSFFDDKKRSVCILSLTSILKILLPERQINPKIYNSFEMMINNLNSKNWIELYIHWELSLIKELGYEVNLLNEKNNESKEGNFIEINNKSLKIPKIFLKNNIHTFYSNEIREALTFNKELLLENFINPNGLRFPLFRNILESYYN
jgi:DNA repair protein RecO (recombination protein O)